MMIGQVPTGTSRSRSKASTVAEISQIGARSRVACFAAPPDIRMTVAAGIRELRETSATCLINAAMELLHQGFLWER